MIKKDMNENAFHLSIGKFVVEKKSNIISDCSKGGISKKIRKKMSKSTNVKENLTS